MTDSSVRKIIARAGEQAQLGFPVHPHMLRHACGFKLANEGHDTRTIKRQLIEVAIEAHGGNRTRAAASLGLQRTYLLRLIKQLKPRCPAGQVGGRRTRKL